MNQIHTFFKKINFRSNAIWLIPLLIIATFPLWSIPLGNFFAPRGGVNHALKKNQIPHREFNLKKIQITQNQNGRKTAFIIASKAQTGEDPDTLLMDNVDADIYNKAGEITKITALKGEYNTKTELLTLTGDVVVRKIADKQTLYTELLYYSNQEQTVECPGPTKIVAPDAIITSGNLLYDIEKAQYDLGNPVHCILTNFDNNT